MGSTHPERTRYLDEHRTRALLDEDARSPNLRSLVKDSAEGQERQMVRLLTVKESLVGREFLEDVMSEPVYGTEASNADRERYILQNENHELIIAEAKLRARVAELEKEHEELREAVQLFLFEWDAREGTEPDDWMMTIDAVRQLRRIVAEKEDER